MILIILPPSDFEMLDGCQWVVTILYRIFLELEQETPNNQENLNW